MSFRTPPPLRGLAKSISTTFVRLLGLASLALMMGAGMAAAQDSFDALSAEDAFALFGTDHGDPFTSVFLNQLFGPLFPSASGSVSTTVFSEIIGYFNVIILVVGGILFFYNVTVGVLQSAHEGQVLGRNWSSLWAPLRTIFAVGLLVPVPGLGGYNTAQSGVAYVVRGATNMASTVWGASAELVITGRVAIAAPPPTIQPEVLKTMYENAACTAIINYQMNQAAASTDGGPPAYRVVYRTFLSPGGVRTSISYLDGGSGPAETRYTREGICGSFETPAVPEFLNRIAGSTANNTVETMDPSTRTAIEDAFGTAHRTSLNTVRSDFEALTARILPDMQAQGPLPNIAGDISATLEGVNEQLSLDMDGILDDAVGDDRVGEAARQALLRRITGGEACGESISPTEPTRCYSEGWIGAGSWYMLMAQLNNEIASLTAAVSSADASDYVAQISDAERDLYVAGGGETGFFGRMGSRAQDAGMLSQEELTLVMARYAETWDDSIPELAALGFPLPTEDLASLNENLTSANDVFLSIPYLSDWVKSFVQSAIAFSSPSNSIVGEDPMIGIINLGQILLAISGVLILAAAAGGFLTGGSLGTMISPFMITTLAAGGTMAFILPMMPFFYWVLAVTGYFLLIAEAIVAVNLWGLAHMRMDGDGISGEAGRYGWLMFLSLLVSPVLMVFGFLLGMGIFRVTTALIDIGIHQALSGILGSSIFIMLCAMVVYAVFMSVIYIAILERSFSLVSEFPGRVLRWMGAQADITSAGEENRVRAAAAAAATTSTAGIGRLTASTYNHKTGKNVSPASNFGDGVYKLWDKRRGNEASNGGGSDTKLPPAGG